MTVSAVLGASASSTVRVSAATRERVLEAAKLLNYRPNRLARSLRGQKSNVIGIYTAVGYLNPQVAFTAQIIGGLHRGCDECKKDLLLHGSFRDRSVDEVLFELADGRIDGLVMYTSAEDPLVERMAVSGMPVVGIVDSLPGIPSVVADDAAGAELIAEYLVEKGHRRVFFRSGVPILRSAQHRQQAFLKAAGRHGIQVTVGRPSRPDDQHEVVGDSELHWLSLPDGVRPTAAVCWNDLTAYHMLDALSARGVKVPGDLAVIGFDGIIPNFPTPYRLTTILAPWVDVAAAAVHLLNRRLQGDELPPETILPVEFLPGDTA
jgi:LacI family transcriptional regulator/LacI family purine nucleotide synthesis repressor